MSSADVLGQLCAQVRAQVGDDPRLIDLVLWGTHFLRWEPCESCGAPLTLQEYTSTPSLSPDETAFRWMEVVAAPGPGRENLIIRDHDGPRCREVRAAGTVS